MRRKSLEGQRFGRLLVSHRDEAKSGKNTFWYCECDCRTIKSVRQMSLLRGETKSCGCYSREQTSRRRKTHGMSKTKIYRLWAGMLNRCYNKNEPFYKDYGGRGIQVCREWRKSFTSFYRDMWPTYRRGLVLDRIDNDKNYSKQNCRWTDDITSTRNRRTVRQIRDLDGVIRSLPEIAQRLGIRRKMICARIYRGWPEEKWLLPRGSTKD